MYNKKIMSVLICASMLFAFNGCTPPDEGTSEESDTKKNDYSVAETKKKQISMSEAYEIAEAYVPQAVLNSAMLKKATNYKVTNYEYLGSDEDSYNFKFYGKWYQFDNYDNLKDEGKFYAEIDVPFNGKITFAMAYPEF